MRVLSLGAGVQSSAMLLMALEGRFGEMPDCAIFADTQWEPKAVYDWLERLEREVAPFPIHRVTAGNIRDDATSGKRFAMLPFFLGNASRGRAPQQCSREYKIQPMRRFLRKLGVSSAEVWIGISTDEVVRMKPSDVKWITNRYPLIDAGMSRENCVTYLTARLGSVAPKSSCIGCPHHNEQYWSHMKATSPAELEEAVHFDKRVRRLPGMDDECFLHDRRVPLGDIKEFRHEKQGRMFWDSFSSECEGVCGT